MNAYCPHCKQKYEIEADMLGQTAECEACHKDFVIKADVPRQPQPVTGTETSNKEQPAPSRTMPTIAIAITAGALIVLTLGGVSVWKFVSTKNRAASDKTAVSAPPVEKRPTVSAPPARSPEEAHDQCIKDALVKWNDKLVVPQVSSAYANKQEREYQSLIKMAGYDSDRGEFTVGKFYYLCARSKDKKSLTGLDVSSLYEWSLIADPKLKDVIKVTDSDLYTKEAIYECTVRTYRKVFTHYFDKDSPVYKFVADKCTGGAYFLAIDFDLRMKSDVFSKILDATFLKEVSLPIMDEFKKSQTDTSATHGELVSSESKTVRLRFHGRDKTWTVYE
jgi:hypothetical protein